MTYEIWEITFSNGATLEIISTHEDVEDTAEELARAYKTTLQKWCLK